MALLAFLQFSIILDFMIISPLGAIIMPDLGISPQLSDGADGGDGRPIGDKIERETRFYITSLASLACQLGPVVNAPCLWHGHSCRENRRRRGVILRQTRDVPPKVNVPDAAQAVPDAVRNAPLPTQTRVVTTQLAPGVILLGGGSHNSVAVEFKDFVTVIEGPLSNQRTNAVVAEVRKAFPNKPIEYLVNTHNHFDHLGGVRGFVAEGATVITDDKNRNFYQRVVLAPQSRTLAPDRLSHRPFAPTGPGTLELQTFTDRYTISDGNETIEIYHVDGLNHSDNMLVAYLPKEKIVINADLYGPPPAGGNLANVNNNAVVLYRNLKWLKLDVAQHVPIHGNPGSNADFERIVGPVAARTPVQGGGG